MNITENRTKIILDYLINNNAEICRYYGEQGYSDPENGIILYDWNDEKMSRNITDYLESAGYELEWCDEWIINYSTSKAYRSSPDSYMWKPYYILNEWSNGDVIGIDEIESDPDLMRDYVYELLLDNSNHVSLANIDDYLESEGFEPVDETFQNGFHYGMNDKPDDILRYWNDKNYHVVFSSLTSSQFYVEFNIHVKPFLKSNEGITMYLRQLKANQTIVNLGYNLEIFFSYNTPVAGMDKHGYFKTDQYYSKTTSRHINQYLESVNFRIVSQSYINNLVTSDEV